MISEQARADIEEICDAAELFGPAMGNRVFHAVREARKLEPGATRLLYDAVRKELRERGLL